MAVAIYRRSNQLLEVVNQFLGCEIAALINIPQCTETAAPMGAQPFCNQNRRVGAKASIKLKFTLICDRFWENQPVSEKIYYRVRAEIVVRARRR